QPFTFTPFSSNTNPGTVALDPSKLTQTTVAGLTTASDWNWTNNANGFAFAWTTPSTKSGVATKTINIDFFDINGNQKGLTNSSVIIPASASWGISNDSNYNTGSSYFVFTIDNANSSLNILNKFTFDGSIVTQVLSGGSFTPTSVQLLLDVGSIRGWNWSYTTPDSTGKNQNYELAVSGTRNGLAVIDFYKFDNNNIPLMTQSVGLTGAIANDRISVARLSDNVSTIFAYQDALTLHLTEIGSDGKIVQDYTQTLQAGAQFDRIRSLGDGRFEVEWRTIGLSANTNIINTEIFDTRTASATITGSSTNPALIANPASGKNTTTVTTPNSIVIAKAGDTITASPTATNSTISFEGSNDGKGNAVGVTFALGKDITTAATAAGGDAAGDTIKGFTNIIGSQSNDTLTGDTRNNTIIGGGGNDTIIGGAGSDTAIYQGNFADYKITPNVLSGTYTITDSASGRDGTDTLVNISALQFKDQLISLAPIAPPVSTTPASQKVISEYSPIIMLDVNSANKIFRPQMSSWSGDQIWTISSLPASSYQSATGVVNQVDINLKIENRLGEAGIKIPITTSWNNHNGNDAFSITFAQAANSSAVNSAVMWLDLGSATGVNYTLKFQPFTFTPFSSNTNPGTVALDPSKLTQTTVAGL
ncbi:MAG: hypothetical protein EBY22_12585, partial [Gammaproteobacteria bacterium]|nr:hypothetical protein [Gammaproteobacteria bacterium]